MSTTRLIENIDFEYWECEQWECEQCGAKWTFEYGTPGDNSYYYCPNCGRKIIGIIFTDVKERGGRGEG